MIVEKAGGEDAAAILTLQKLAYQDEAAIYYLYKKLGCVPFKTEKQTDRVTRVFLEKPGTVSGNFPGGTLPKL